MEFISCLFVVKFLLNPLVFYLIFSTQNICKVKLKDFKMKVLYLSQNFCIGVLHLLSNKVIVSAFIMARKVCLSLPEQTDIPESSKYASVKRP